MFGTGLVTKKRLCQAADHYMQSSILMDLSHLTWESWLSHSPQTRCAPHCKMTLIICVAAAVLASATDVARASLARATTQQPNIILFVIDDLGFADLSLVSGC